MCHFDHDDFAWGSPISRFVFKNLHWELKTRSLTEPFLCWSLPLLNYSFTEPFLCSASCKSLSLGSFSNKLPSMKDQQIPCDKALCLTATLLDCRLPRWTVPVAPLPSTSSMVKPAGHVPRMEGAACRLGRGWGKYASATKSRLYFQLSLQGCPALVVEAELEAAHVL